MSGELIWSSAVEVIQKFFDVQGDIQSIKFLNALSVQIGRGLGYFAIILIYIGVFIVIGSAITAVLVLISFIYNAAVEKHKNSEIVSSEESTRK